MKRTVLICAVAAGWLSAAIGAHAAGIPADDSVTLHIDEGFLGHPVTFDVLDGRARLSWNAGDVIATGDVTIGITSSSEVTLLWSSSYMLGPNGVTIGIRQSTGTSVWDDPVIEAKAPLFPWKRLASKAESGFVTARIGPEATMRIASVPRGMRAGTASWYRYKGCACAASPDFPKGTNLRVRLQDDPSKSVTVRVNDYGPDRALYPSRVIDLDSTAFKTLAPLSRGMVRVTVEPIQETVNSEQ